VPLVYGPIIPYLAALVSPLFGARMIAPLAAGRLITICATIAICLLIYRLGRRAGAGSAAAFITSAAFALSPLLEPSGFEFRVDMPALAFDLGGVALFQAGLAYPGLAMFLLCFFTKQMRAAGIAAVVLYTWLNGRRRDAVRMGALYLGGLILVIAVLQIFNRFYWLNNYAAVALADDFLATPRWIGSLTSADFMLCALAVVGAYRATAKGSLTVCFLIAAAIQDTASSLHWGSNVIYFTPTLAAAAAVASSQLDRILARSREFAIATQIAFGVAIAWTILAPVLGTGDVNEPGLGSAIDRFRVGANCAASAESPWDAMAQQVAEIHGIVLTNVPEVALIDRSHEVWYLDLMLLRGLHQRGLLDDRPLIAALDQRRIAVVALGPELLQAKWRGRDLFWPQLRQAIERNYVPIASPGPLHLALPKPLGG
jgi:hypothetical protein